MSFFGILKFHKFVIASEAKQSLGILKFLSKIPYYVILGLDQRISVLGNFRRNFDGILDEIASSFVSLTPCNDGILDKIPKFPKSLALR